MGTEPTIVSTLLENEEYIDIIKSFLDDDIDVPPWKGGLDYTDVAASPQILSQMVQDEILEIARRNTSDPNAYQLRDEEEARQAITLVESEGTIGPDGDEQEETEDTGIPDDIFDIVIGHDPVKDLLMRGINTDEQVHFRLQGESSTAKSVFLTELERLPGAKYRSASGMTEAGLLDILIEQQPKYLLFDEIDKADKECYTPLYELTEHGRVQKTISGGEIDIELNCNLVVTLNHPEKLPEELRKRLVKLEFEEYDDDEYIEVVSGVLQDKYDLSEEVASFIADYQLEQLEDKNVREPEQIAKLAEDSIEDVKKVINQIEEYRI